MKHSFSTLSGLCTYITTLETHPFLPATSSACALSARNTQNPPMRSKPIPCLPRKESSLCAGPLSQKEAQFRRQCLSCMPLSARRRRLSATGCHFRPVQRHSFTLMIISNWHMWWKENSAKRSLDGTLFSLKETCA